MLGKFLMHAHETNDWIMRGAFKGFTAYHRLSNTTTTTTTTTRYMFPQIFVTEVFAPLSLCSYRSMFP